MYTQKVSIHENVNTHSYMQRINLVICKQTVGRRAIIDVEVEDIVVAVVVAGTEEVVAAAVSSYYV